MMNKHTLKSVADTIDYKTQDITIKLPHFNYLNRVMLSNCFEEYKELFINCDNAAKEITESFSAFRYLKKYTLLHGNPTIHLGDGSRIRTAALFSLYSKGINISIDPQINNDVVDSWISKWKIKNTYYEKSEFELLEDKFYKKYTDNQYYNITSVHGHVNLEKVSEKFPNWLYLYSNPCCMINEQTFSIEYMKSNGIELIEQTYDLGILSQERKVFVYKNIKNQLKTK